MLNERESSYLNLNYVESNYDIRGDLLYVSSGIPRLLLDLPGHANIAGPHVGRMVPRPGSGVRVPEFGSMKRC